MENGQYVDGSIWFFAPNKVAPVIFAVAFASSGVFHVWQCIHYNSWRLTGLYVFCAMLFTGAFITRVLGAFDYGDLIKYIISLCLSYAAPPLYELCNYNILGRILYYAPYHSPVHPGRVITTFGVISFVIEVLNGNGASYSANQSLTKSQQDLGHNLLKAALLLQVVVIGCFLMLAGVFQYRCRKAGINNPNMNGALYTLYASTALISVRTVYRIVEYWSLQYLNFDSGFDPMTFSPLIRYEWFFYVFEASLMICNQVLLNVRHPRKYLPKSTKTYLARDGVTEITGPGLKDGRSFLVTVLDPFDVWGLIKGRDKQNNFWETHEAEAVKTGAPRNREDPESA